MISRLNRLLAEFLPEKYRDEIVGDLVEQSVSNAGFGHRCSSES